RDAGGAGAFARVEGRIDVGIAALKQEVAAVGVQLRTEVNKLDSRLTALRDDGEADRDTRSKRRWDLIIGVIAGLAAGVATVVATILATGHHP
ncbi:MAG TPA: hypothetical protein VMV09_08925, partial [Candidatus Saccharimonadales bacterium]|nr:hypothetical protein [Candidatus Saccharimonadales bacterium]